MRNLLSILIILLSISSAYAHDYSIQKRWICFTEKSKESSTRFYNQSLPKKTQRLSNNEGQIILSFDDELPDTIKVALNAAKKLWESRLPCKQPIHIEVTFEPLNQDIAMEVYVGFFEDGKLQGCPTALGSQLSNYDSGQPDSPNGIIVFNSYINWNCIFSAENTTDYNLPTMALRGIARCLGFGSSILEDYKDVFIFYNNFPTYFDNLLFHNSKCLSDIVQGSTEMASFVKSDDVFVKVESGQYRIYAPKQYLPHISLCYLDDTNSLMSYDIGKGSIYLDIDDKTYDILQSIGWNISSSSLDIKCNDISDDGLGSSYTSHTFTLSKGNESVTNYDWRFLLKNKRQEYVQVSSGSSENFTISKISSPEQYYVNVNGDLEGRIECNYTANGNKHYAKPFSLSLEMKPIINSIDNLLIINDNQFEFSLMFNVQYTGAEYVSVEIEEEDNTCLRNYTFMEPYLAHVKTGRISNLCYSWVTIIASNKYGKTYETLDYSPLYGSLKKVKNNDGNCRISFGAEIIRQIQIFDMNGNLIYIGPSDDFHKQIFQKGIYIKKELYENGKTKTSKVSI